MKVGNRGVWRHETRFCLANWNWSIVRRFGDSTFWLQWLIIHNWVFKCDLDFFLFVFAGSLQITIFHLACLTKHYHSHSYHAYLTMHNLPCNLHSLQIYEVPPRSYKFSSSFNVGEGQGWPWGIPCFQSQKTWPTILVHRFSNKQRNTL
jgi:hypothetical protein